MSEHAPVVVKPADDQAFKLPTSLAGLVLPLCAGGFIALIIGWSIGFSLGPKFAMSAYLAAFMYCATIALGSMFFVLIQHLVRAGWSVVVRRIAELMMVMVIPLAVLFLPIMVTLFTTDKADSALYVWDTSDYAPSHHLDPIMWESKTAYLSAPFFCVRALFYFAIWVGLAIYFFRGSANQDNTGEKAVTDRMQWWSAPAVMLLAGTMSFAAFDWVMTLSPMWFSTMFGVYMFAGAILSAHCAIALGAYVLQKKGALKDEITVEHYHDLGKLIFGFIFFWVYISFSQFMLIWYGNIPEETEWFWLRQNGTWGWVAVVLILLHWLLPFVCTMSRTLRRKPGYVAFWALYILVMHFIDIYWMIMPETGPTAGSVMGVLSSVLCVVGMAAVMLSLILKVASDHRVAAVRDPRFRESMAFENI